ncbi:MAG: hypothetical protein ACFFD8_08255 [Candidatus Thorarchaeota archaeon]
MLKKPEKGKFGDLVVVATLDEIAKGARRVIGAQMKIIEKEGGIWIFSDESSACPLQVKAIPLQKGVYRLDVGSVCTVKNCDYFGQCARLDARAAKSLEQAMAQILNEPERVYEGRTWQPERLDKDEKLQKIIDRIINEGI